MTRGLANTAPGDPGSIARLATAAGVVQRAPTLTPFTARAAVSVSHASASVPGTGITNCISAERWLRKCVR